MWFTCGVPKALSGAHEVKTVSYNNAQGSFELLDIYSGDAEAEVGKTAS